MFNFSWVVPGLVAGMAAPSPEDADELREQGVTAVISLTRRPGFHPAPPGLRLLHLPVVDMTPPTVEQLRRAVDYIHAESARGGRTVVHCAAGVGRTGTVLACVLVARGMEAADAIARVRALRFGSIETAAQEHAVHLFAEAHGAGPDGHRDERHEEDA